MQIKNLNHYGNLIFKQASNLHIKFPYYFLISEEGENIVFWSYNITNWTLFLNKIKYSNFIEAKDGFFLISISKKEILDYKIK